MVRDYVGSVTLGQTLGGVSWAVHPAARARRRMVDLVPGAEWLIALLSKRTLNRVLDAVAASSAAR